MDESNQATVFVEVSSSSPFVWSWYEPHNAKALRRLLQPWVKSFCWFDFGDGLKEGYIDYVQHCLKVTMKEQLLILRYSEQSDWYDLYESLGKEAPVTPCPVMGDEPSILDGQSRMYIPRMKIALGSAYTLGAILTAVFCSLLINSEIFDAQVPRDPAEGEINRSIWVS